MVVTCCFPSIPRRNRKFGLMWMYPTGFKEQMHDVCLLDRTWYILQLQYMVTVRNLECRSVRFRSDTFQIISNLKKNGSSCLIVVSPRGSTGTKETAGMNVFFLSKQWVFFRDKPFIETMAANLMTSGPCQLKLTIEGSERNSRHKLGSIDTDLKYPCNNRHRQQNAK